MSQTRGKLAIIMLCVAVAVVVPSALVFAGIAPPDAGVLSAFVLSVAVVAWLRSQIPALLLVFLTVALVATIYEQPWLNLAPSDVETDAGTTVTDAWLKQGPFDESLPVVIHVILDELISPGAIDPSVPGGAAARDAMYAFGQTHGLRVFDSVYSRYFFSGVAIPNLMQAEYQGLTEFGDIRKTIDEAPNPNAYFEDMAARGYRTMVFQTAVLDFCQPPEVRGCETFRSFDPGVAAESNLDQRTRVLNFWDTFLRAYEPSALSSFGRWVLRRASGLDQRELGVLGVSGRFDPQGFPRWFDRFVAVVSQVPRGTHIVAHMLVPHSPYVLTNECVVAGEFDSGYYLGGRFDLPDRRAEARAKYYGEYFGQVGCVMNRLDALMQMVAQTPHLRDAVVVIHGDHGSRISVGNIVEDYAAQDFVDNYGTFFAVRAPGVAAGVDCTFTSLGQVFRRIVRGAAAAQDDPTPLAVVVSSRASEGAVVEAPMPVFGCAAGS